MKWNASGLLVAVCCFAALQGGENADKKKKEDAEEAFRKEATELMSAKIGKEGEGIVSLEGRFTLSKELARDEKPTPKAVGYISSKGTAFPVIAPTMAVINILAGFDNKDVTLCGKILDKGDQGKYLVVSEVIMPPAPPPLKRKRGGLP